MNRILVTGHNGFVGRNLIPKLITQKAELILPSKEDCDLRSYEQTNNFIARYNPNIIIHLAAVCGGIGANKKQPYKFLHHNLLINNNIVQASINNNIKKLVTFGSVCAYPKITPLPFKEEDIWNGQPESTNHGYGESKRVLMLMCQVAREQYGLNAIHLIPTNMYGRHDNFDPETSHVIPALIQKAHRANKRPLTVWGTGNASRDFLHVSDCCNAIIQAAEHYNGVEPINIGSGKEVSIKGLVAQIAKIIGYEGTIIYDKNKPDGQPRRRLDISRADKLLGWQPKIDLEKGLTDLIQWWRYNNGY